jgi:L-ascorbate metabolism protein UlaG (beta-lactamase superfamily)
MEGTDRIRDSGAIEGAGRITFLGHATALIELGGTRLLTDPLLRSRLGFLRRRHPPLETEGLAGVDAVLLSHIHFDHLDLPSLRLLGREVPIVASRGASAFLERAGFERVTELAVGETTRVGEVEVTATPAAHDGRRRPFGARAEAVGFLLTGPRRVYFAGDTDLFDGMAQIGPGVDVALLPIWGWGPDLGPGHLDPKEAARALALIRPRVCIPIHWGTFTPIGAHRIWPHILARPVKDFLRHAADEAPEVEVRVLEPGSSLPLAPPGGIE